MQKGSGGKSTLGVVLKNLNTHPGKSLSGVALQEACEVISSNVLY